MNQNLGSRAPMAPAPEEFNEEGAGLIANAAVNPSNRVPSPFREYEAEPYGSDLGYRGAAQRLHQQEGTVSYQQQEEQHTHALSTNDYYQTRPGVNMSVYAGRDEGSANPEHDREVRGPQADAERPRDSTQATVGAALWGENPHQHPGGPMI